MSEQPTPGLDILNAGAGHIEIRYDNNDPMEIERAKRIIGDMLKRGYSLFIEGKDKLLTRVEQFDPVKGVYLIADLGDPVVEAHRYEGEAITEVTQPKVKRGRGRPRKEVAVTAVRTTAIGRSAGG